MASRQRRLSLVQAWLTPREFYAWGYRALKRTARFIAAATRQFAGQRLALPDVYLSSICRKLEASRAGGAPKSLEYSRLNCEALS
jgi:hypothetical protein